ncbi:ester cyclase [Actinomycetospora endophytica]|uniref:Ester cyclase n=1 Tax=Actinomycetospora endophytica TaxID=2291215 RepID=A0ABS8P3S1_9PSEU|nr:nuclear transport factor 2 family protein [Actinomycetospora endophytica]MCD2192900.1 ester cyclase [Actinomycetospora endophytica]
MNTRELTDRMLDTWNAKDGAAWAALFTDDAMLRAPGGVTGSGPEMVMTFFRLWQESFPDNQCRAVRTVGGEASGTVEAVFEGTHTETLHAPSGDVPATGRRVSIPFVNVCEFAGDRMTYFALYFDQIDLLTQLGLVAAPVG